MATAETVELGLAHEPKEESIRSFEIIETDLKKALQHSRHDADKHEPQYYARVKDLTDAQLTNFTAEDLVLVRVAKSAYGLHILGKVSLPASKSGYIHFRAFVSGDGVKFHSIHTEEKEVNGDKVFNAIFNFDTPLEWFET